MSNILRYLEEKKFCPHCKEKLLACEAPPIHVGDGLGWGSEVLFICLNDLCPVFTEGWEKIEAGYGHHASYRYMELPGSKEKNYMMVGNADAFKASVIKRDVIEAQNERYRRQKEMIAKLADCVAAKDTETPLALLLEEAAPKDKRKEAARCLAALADLSVIDPVRNHSFRDPAMEHAAKEAIVAVLKRNFMKECPYCAELIKQQAKKCKHCQSDI